MSDRGASVGDLLDMIEILSAQIAELQMKVKALEDAAGLNK